MSDLYLPARFHIPSRRKFLECELDVRCALSAKYKVQIVRDGKVVREPFGDKWLPNLITNGCFDYLLNGGTITNLLSAIKAGTSATTPTNADTALGALWAASNTVTGSGAGTVNDTVNGYATHTVSIDFAAAGSGVGLNEVGLNNTTGAAGAILTHALFPSQVNLSTGDILRVAYTVTFSVPSLITAVPISLSAINGFNISGSMKTVGTFATLFGAINAAGAFTTNPNLHYVINSVAASAPFLCSAPTAFPSVNAAISTTTLGTAPNGTLATYTNGTFTRNQTHVWLPSNPNTTVSNVNGILLNSALSSYGLYLLLSAVQTKANTNTLTVITNCTLARA